MALVDYKGFRLIAMSILPLKGSRTIKYGSNNAGNELIVHDDDEKLSSSISEASKRLMLKVTQIIFEHIFHLWSYDLLLGALLW